MDRERLALGFGETIESLRNEVESMWDDIQLSFDKIDREIDETISRYKPTGYYDNKNANDNLTAFDIDTTQILYESDNPNDDNINDTNITRYSDNANKYRLKKPIKMAAINSMASSISSASGASPNIDDYNYNYNIEQKPIAKSIYTKHQSAYSTPIHAHIMNSASFSPTSPNYNINKRILKNYNSNHSDISDIYTDDIHDNTNEITFDKRLSKTHELLSDLNDFNRNDTVHNAPVQIPGVAGLDPNQKSFRIELSNPNDSPKGSNQREINHIDDIDIDNNNVDIGIDDIDSDQSIVSIHHIDNNSDSQITVDRMQLINRISIDLETNAHIFQHRNSHHERNNTMHKNIFNDGNISDEDELDLTKINRDDQNSDENSGHSSLAYLFKDNESDSDTQSDTDSEHDLIVVSNRINSKQRLSIPKGLSNIDVTELANSSSHSANNDSNDEDTYIQTEDIQQTDNNNNNNNNNYNTEQDDKYPLALPMIPQTSSVDHKLDAAQTPQDVSNKHEKKKSISQLALQDLELDRKVNINNHHKNMRNVKMNNISYKDAPLTPLAMMTQIGIAEMNDMPDISDISNINSKSVPSPPGINGHGYNYKVLNTTKITPTQVRSDDYIDIFNSDRNGSGVFKFDGNNNITDINYENNHNLQSGINRADSNYESMINKGIDIILKETSLYEKEESKRRNSTNVMVSPEVKNKNTKLNNNVSYSFEDMNNSKTPIINEENIGEYIDMDLDLNNIIFEDIEETLLIIKKNGEEYINDICDRLANEDLFYINEFIEIDKQSEEFYKLNMFLDKYNKNIHNINNDVKSVILLFNELLLNNSIVIIPLYRVHAIHFLYECIIRYQTLKLLNDEVSSNEKQINENNENNNNNNIINHLKKPTDELPDIDNSHFHDYNEYPSDDNDDNIQKIDDDHINDGNLRQLFSIHNVYAPKNKNEYNIIKNVLCPNTKYYNYNIYNIIGNNNNNNNKYECMECIGIIKPNAVINGYESLIRATLIGNGFIIPKCKTIKYNKNEIVNIYNHRLNMDGYKYYIENNINMNKIYEYLSSGCIIIMIIKKYIGLNRNDECLNVSDCFNKLNELIGYVDPQIDRINDENTQSIRGCFGEDYIKNIIDITTTKKDYKNNVQLFFDIDQ